MFNINKYIICKYDNKNKVQCKKYEESDFTLFLSNHHVT